MHALALTLPLLAASAAPNDPIAPPAQSGDSVGGRVDLRALDALLPDAIDDESVRTFTIVPLMRALPARPEEIEGIDAETRALPSKAVASLIVDHYGENLAVIESIGEGVYYVSGDEATVAGIQGLARHVTEAAIGAPRVRVTRLATSGPEAARRIRAGAALDDVGEVLSVRETTLFPGVPARCADLTTNTVVAQPWTQIAQGSAILDPEVIEAATGVDLLLSCRRESEGVRITYTLAHTDRVEARRSKGASAPALFGSEGGAVELFQRMGWNESYAVEGGAVGAEAFVRPGQRAVVSGRAGEALVMEIVAGGARRDVADFELPDGRLLLVYERAAVSAPSLAPGGKLPRANYSIDHSAHALQGPDSHSLTAIWRAAAETPFEIMWSAIDDYPTTTTFSGLAATVLEPEAAARLRPWFDFMAASDALALEVDVARIGGGGREVIGTLETISGNEAMVAVGSEELVAKDSDVEVAQFAAIEQPSVTAHFEGFAGLVQLSVLPGGRLAYEVRGQISDDIGRSERSRTFDTAGGADAIEARHVTLDERGVATAGQDGRWRIVLGDATGNGPGVELVVAARR